jgi:hypothetical protein
MQPNRRRFRSIKEITGDCLLCIPSQFLPRVPLCENVVRKALGYEAAVGFLRDAENDFHAHTMPRPAAADKLRVRRRGYL